MLPSDFATLAVLENHVDLLGVWVIDDLLEGDDVRMMQLLQDGDLLAHLILGDEFGTFSPAPPERRQALLAITIHDLDGVERALAGGQIVLQLILRGIHRHVAAQAYASVRSVTNLVEHLEAQSARCTLGENI